MHHTLLKKTLFIALVISSLITSAAYAKDRAKGFRLAAKAVQQETESRPRTQAEIFARTELYFGSQKPDGSVVSEAEYQRFLDEEITPRFPDGLTVLTGYGQFKNSAGAIIKERSMALILLYPPRQRSANRKIEEIREAYKRAFQQESVLRVDSLAAVSF